MCTLQRVVFMAVIWFISWGAGRIANAQSIPLACRRENLKKLADAYLAALESHNATTLSLAQNLKFTENGKELAIGKGLWATAGKTLLKRSVVDTFKCSVHTQAVLEEAGRPIIFGVRLRLNETKISEIETFVARENEFAFNAKELLNTKMQDWESILPIEQRSSRLAMIAAADDYFNMFVKTPRVSVSFASPCDRWENGTLTTISASGVSKIEGTPEHDCSPKGLVTPHHQPRRFLVDLVAGVVVAYVLFASSLPDFHMFKIRNGKIELIQAVIGANSVTMGWPDEPIFVQ
jgi:hypothetical protein